MHNSKVLNLLKTFSKDEFRDFGLFVKSSFYNRESVIIRLYNILKEYYPEFECISLQKKSVYSKLYPQKHFNDALLRNTISDLLSLAEKYLEHIQSESDPFYRQYLLLKELTNRKQQVLFKMNFKKAENILKSSEVRDEIYYHNKFLLEDEFRRNVVVNSSRILFKDDNIDDQARSLHIQHLTENIKLYAIMLNQKKFTFDHKFDFSLMEVLTDYLEKNYQAYKNIPYITIFYNCVMLFKTEEKKYFDELKGELKKHYRELSITDRKNMFIVLTNHCNMQIKKGRYEFCRESFVIYKEFIRTKAYYEGNDFMAHYIYRSAVSSALDVKEFEWAEKFINNHRTDVHIDFRDSSFNFCYSQLYLLRGEYDKALESLSKVQTFDFKDKQNVNQSLLQIYFCKNETESFLSLVDSFRHFLKRNDKVRKLDFKMLNNFITYIKRLYGIKHSRLKTDKADLNFLKKELERNNEISSRKWLLERIDELLDQQNRHKSRTNKTF